MHEGKPKFGSGSRDSLAASSGSPSASLRATRCDGQNGPCGRFVNLTMIESVFCLNQ